MPGACLPSLWGGLRTLCGNAPSIPGYSRTQQAGYMGLGFAGLQGGKGAEACPCLRANRRGVLPCYIKSA